VPRVKVGGSVESAVNNEEGFGTAMQMRRLGRTDLQVSCIGFGGIPIRRPPTDEAVRLYRQAMDLGINYFDTARGYERGEERLAQAIKGRRDQVIIASKTGAPTGEKMLEEVEASLGCLGTDYIDIYKYHGICELEVWEKANAPGGAMDGLRMAREQGKIRFIGVSGHNADVLTEIVRSGDVDVILVIYNYIANAPERTLLPACKEMDVGVTVMKPLGGSVLAGQADLALRYILQHDTHAACVGMWREAELLDNLGVGENPAPLTQEEMGFLEELRAFHDRYFCRLCYRHWQCPYGVQITGLMIADLCYVRHGLEEMLGRGWREQVLAAEKCLTCDQREACRKSCPYGLDIGHVLGSFYQRIGPIVRERA